MEALKQLSTFYKENTIQARRNLRSQVEKRSLEINKSVLNSFHEVKTSFDCLYNEISSMNSAIQDMTSRLQNTKLQTKQLLQQTKVLQEERDKNVMQENLSSMFLEKYQLSPDDIIALHGNKNKRDMVLTNDIYTSLDHVQNIHNNCKLLMQSGMQTLAVDIMEQMTLHQEGALERLYRWTLNHSRNVDNPDLTDTIAKAMNRLQNRPLLLK